MPAYLCRWPNGDVSIVSARNKTDAVILLDEFDNAESAQITRMNELLIDFRLDDEGDLQLRTLGEATQTEIMDRAFPDLRETQLSDELMALDDTSEEYREKVRQAVEQERQRLWDKQKSKKRRSPKTELGKRIQKQTGAAAVVVDRWVEEISDQILEKTDEDETVN